MLTKALILGLITTAARANFDAFLTNPTDANFRVVDADILAVQNTTAIDESILVEKLMKVAPEKWAAAIADMNLKAEKQQVPEKPAAKPASSSSKKPQTSGKSAAKPKSANKPAPRPVVEEDEEV